MRRILRHVGTALVAGGLIVALAGCHTMRFELVNEPAAHVITEHKSYFLWGLAPTVDVDVLEKCPNGAAALREQTTFLDGLAGLPTLYIWNLARRSTTAGDRTPSFGASDEESAALGAGGRAAGGDRLL